MLESNEESKRKGFLLRENDLVTALILLAMIAVAAVLERGSPYVVHVLILVVFFSALSCAWNIIGGMGGQLALGHSAFVGVGGYVSTLFYLNLGLTPWIGMFAGAIASCILSLVIGAACFRKLRGAYFALATIALTWSLKVFVENTEYIRGVHIRGATGLVIKPLGYAPAHYQFDTKIAYFWVVVVLFLLVVTISYIISKSKMGYYLAAIKNDQDAAECLGVNVMGMKLTAFGISAFLTSLMGTFYAQYILFLEPRRVFGLDLTIEIVVAAIIGGLATISGPVIGSVILVLISEVIRVWLGGRYFGVHLAVYGIILMITIMYMPGGIRKHSRVIFSALLQRFAFKRERMHHAT